MHSEEHEVRCTRYQKHNKIILNKRKQDDSNLRPKSARRYTRRHGWEENHSETLANEKSYIQALHEFTVSKEKNNPIPRVHQDRHQVYSRQTHIKHHSDYYDLTDQLDANKSPSKHERTWKHILHDDIRKELIDTKKRLNDIQTFADHLEEENETLNRECSDLETELEEYKYDYTELLDNCGKLEMSREKYRKKLSARAFQHNLDIETAKDEIYQLQQKNDNLENTLHKDKEAFRERFETKVQQYNLTITKLEDDKNRSSEEISSMKHEIATLQAKLDETTSKLELCNKHANVKTGETRNRLHKHGDIAKTVHERQITNLKNKAAQLESDKVDLKTKFIDMENEWQNQLRHKENELTETKRDLENTKRRLQNVDSNAKANYESRIANLEREKHKLQVINADVETKYGQAEKELNKLKTRHAGDYEALQTQLQRNNKELNETRLELENTKKRLQTVEFNAKASVETKLANAQQEKLELAESKSVIETSYGKMKIELNQQLHFKDNELTECKLELTNTRTRYLVDIKHKENEIASLRNELTDLKASLTKTKQDTKENIEIVTRETDIKYKKDIARLQQKIIDLQNMVETISKGNKRLMEDNDRHKQMSEKASIETTSKSENQEREYRKLSDELYAAKARLRKVSDDLESKEHENAELRDRLAKINKSRKNIEDRIRAIELEKENMVSEYKDKVSTFEKKTRDLKRHRDEIAQENVQLKTMYEQSKTSSNDMDILKQRLNSSEMQLTDARDRLRNISKEVESKNNENVKLHARLDKVLQTNKNTEERIRAIQFEKENLVSEVSTFDQKIRDLKRHRDELSKENDELKTLYNQTQTQSSTNMDILQQRINNTEKELIDARQRLTNISKEIESKDNKNLELQAMLDKLHQTNKNTEEVRSAMELDKENLISEYKDKVSALQQKTCDLKGHRDELSKESDELKTLYKETQTQSSTNMDILQQRLKNTEQELIDTRKRLTNISKEIESKDNKNLELQARLDKLHQTNKNTEEVRSAIELDKENLISEYKDEVHAFEQKIRDLKRRRDELSKENDELKILYQQSQTQSSNDIDILKQRLNNTEKELIDTRKRVREILEENKILTNSVSELKNSLASKDQAYQKKCKADEQKIKDVENANLNLVSQYELKVSSYKEEISDLKRQVRKQSADNDQLKDVSKQNQKLLNDTETLRKRLQRTELELTEAKSTLQKEEMYDRKLSNLEQEKQRLDACNANLERQNTQINEELAEIQNRHRNERDEQQKQLHFAEKKLRETESELANSRTRLRDISEEDTYKSNKIVELRNRLADLEKKFQQTGKNADENVTALQKANSGLVTDNNNMKKRIEDLVTENEKQRKQHKQNEQQSLHVVDGLKQRLHDTEIQLTAATKMLQQEKQNTNMYETKITNLQHEKLKLGASKAELEANNDHMKKEIIKLKNRPDSTETTRYSDNDSDALQRRLRRKEEELKAVELELEDTKTRLSKCMGDKLTNNNPNIVDLSDMNRPSKLADRYKELYDNQWTDAYEILEKSESNERDIIRILLNVLIETKRFCDDHTQMEMKALLRAITHNDNVKASDVPVGVIKYIKDCRKATAAETMRVKFKEYKTDLKRGSKPFATHALTINEYLHECFEVCWLMAIQDPPVVLAAILHHGERFKTDLYSAYTVTGKIVDYSVWPALLLHENGPTLTKGVAQGMKKA